MLCGSSGSSVGLCLFGSFGFVSKVLNIRASKYPSTIR